MGRGYLHTGDVASIDAMSADRAQGRRRVGSCRSISRTSSWRSPGPARGGFIPIKDVEVRRAAAALIVLHAEHFGNIGENDIRPARRLLRRARRHLQIAVPENLIFVVGAAADVGRQGRQEEAADHLTER